MNTDGFLATVAAIQMFTAPPVKVRRCRGGGAARMVEFQGQQVSLKALCKERGISYSTVFSRLESGMTPEEALTKPVGLNGVKRRLS